MGITLSEHMTRIGRITTEKKRQKVRENLSKAREKRWPKVADMVHPKESEEKPLTQ